MTQHYACKKIVMAWQQDKDGQPGYAVKYDDGYTSWSPAAAFDEGYTAIGHVGHLAPHHQRMVAEAVLLDEKVQKLAAFTGSARFNELPSEDRELLLKQCEAMITYQEILTSRIERIK